MISSLNEQAVPEMARRGIKASLVAVALLTTGAWSVSAQDAENGGLSEEYQDWRLQCSANDDAAQTCILQQEQTRQNGERLLVVEISQRQGGSTRGSVLLPFGILFDQGVTLRIDDNASMEPLPFRTCLPTGCVVTFDVGQTLLSQMRTGMSLNVDVTTINGQEMSFPISLSGFTSATNRLSTLTGL